MEAKREKEGVKWEERGGKAARGGEERRGRGKQKEAETKGE